MTKQEALKQIEELKKFIEGEDKKNIITKFPIDENGEAGFSINGVYVGTLFKEEGGGAHRIGGQLSGHKASMFLNFAGGTWFDEIGHEVKGYLYWKLND
jgi:hypothetical protein